MYQLMQPLMGIILFEIIFPLLCFNDNDQTLWDEDPHEFVRKGYDELFFYLISSLSYVWRLEFLSLPTIFFLFMQISLKICIVLEQLPWTL
jgi:hypothetical protein